MAGAIKHRKVSAVADGGDATLVRPQVDWNDSLVASGGTNGQIFVRRTAQTDGWQFEDQAGSYEIRRIVGQNDAVTPNTKYGFSADLVVLRSTIDGSLVTRTNTGTITNDIGLAGSAANGRDQAAAFPAAIQAIHFYYIWNGTTLATLSSLTGPPTGPALPTGYTHWAYTTTVMTDATPNLLVSTTRGAFQAYQALKSVLAGGAATVETSVSVSSFVPAIASRFRLDITSIKAAATAGGLLDILLVIRYVTGVNLDLKGFSSNSVTGSSVWSWPGSQIEVPNNGQAFLYLFSVTQGGGQLVDISVLGYTVPNGDS